MSGDTTRTAVEAQSSAPVVHHPRFARMFNRMATSQSGQREAEELRRETAGQAEGVTLEVGVGGGHNFAFYDLERVERVEAVEPDATMLGFARGRAATAPVQVTLTQAPAEALPFASGSFDTVVATLVFCSVRDPQRALREVMRVLKPGGRLLLGEHVRSHNAAVAWTQSALVPVTTRISGNCHWNRDTELAVREAGFLDVRVRPMGGVFTPIILLGARAPAVEG